MGKKIPEEMEIQRPVFIEGAVKKGKSERFAEGLFDQIETFAGYGFNKSHSAAYAMISYQTAWLKSHYPAQFMAAALSSELGDAEKIQLLLDDINLLGLKILPPDINRSVRDFITIDNETILFGLGAIKGVGEPAIENIIEERKAKTFNSLNDFTSRVDLKRVDKRSIEPLIKSGAMDSFSEDRIVLLKKVEGALRFARQKTETRESGIQDLFGEINDSMKMEENSAPSKFLDLELSKLEFSSLGFYLSFHPMDEHSWEVRKLCPDPIISLGQSKYNQRCAGVLISQKRINTRRGPLVFATLDDKSDRIELIISADVLEKLSNSLDSEIIYIVNGEITEENSKERENLGLSKKMKVSSIQTLEEARIKLINKISLSLDHQNSKKIDNFIKDLKSYSLEDSSEGCPVELRYSSKEVNADIEILDDFKILLNDENIKKLKKSYGIDNIDLHYFSRQ
jgi:DNA polymerase-3 subunit alpha